MKILSIILIINFIFSQANYQILAVPSNFKETFAINDFHEKQGFSVFNSSFPNDIDLFSFIVSTKKMSNKGIFITLKNLDYGSFSDIQNDYIFTAKESLLKFSILRKNLLGLEENINFKIMFSASYLKSRIDRYSSDAISIDLLSSFKIFKNHYANIGLKNWGIVLDSYTNTDIKLPSIFTLSYIFKNNNFPISIFTNYKQRTDLKKETIHVTLELKLNQKLNLYLSTHSDKADLFFGDYIDEIIAGSSIGITYSNNENNFNLGFQNLGAGGYVTSIAFVRAIL